MTGPLRPRRGQWAKEDVRGQGTLEYVFVMAGLLSIVVALGVLWRVLGGGVFVEHHVQAVAPGAVADVFVF